MKTFLNQHVLRFAWLIGVVVLSLSMILATAHANSPPSNVGNVNQQGDVNNVNGVCASAKALQADGMAQPYAFFGVPNPDENWLKFTVQQNKRYRLAVSDAAGLQLILHDRCDVNAPAVTLRDGQLEFTATRDGDYYLLIKSSRVDSANATGYQVTLGPATPYRPRVSALTDVPQDVLRRATEFLEEMRGSDLAPEWQEARVNSNARIFYRPDIQEAAYYEFTVEKPVATGFAPAGFIEVSTGEHDYPVTSWDVSGMSPTQELEEIAPLGAQVTQYYRLDTTSYAAEYEEPTSLGITTVATDVLNIGGLPNRVEGLDAVPEEPFPLVTESINTSGTKTYEGPTELPLLEETGWNSWADLKAGYKEDYDPLLKSLKQRASAYWELDKNLNLYGESLVKGDVRTVYGLASQTILSITVTGDGAATQYLQQEPLGSQNTITGIKLTVLAEPVNLQTRLPFEVGLQYSNGVTETIKYAIVNAAALVSGRLYLPLITNGAQSELALGASPQADAVFSDWGPWRYWWAVGDAGAMTYDQIPAHTRVNTSGCWSGCGATAWAMLFGWVDRRAAEGNASWVNHWGIYRVNGGLGANAVAPLNQDTGVDNMTWEIRGYIGTYCSGSGGATKMSRMIDAINYVKPRATAAATMSTRYDPTKLCWFGACNAARDLARDQIVYRRSPVVLGADNHYPMAYGYAERSKRSCFLWWCSTDVSRWFWVNQGWGGSGNDWINADDVHFAGVYNNP